MAPQRDSLKFRMCNLWKVTKYGMLMRMACEALSGYICNMEVYATEAKNFENTVLS
jgi:hypothetical protein